MIKAVDDLSDEIPSDDEDEEGSDTDNDDPFARMSEMSNSDSAQEQERQSEI